jgi:ribose transport system permease protein
MSGVRRPTALIVAAERYALIGFVLGMVIFFSVYAPTAEVFPTAANLQSVLGNQAVVATAALAAMVPLVGGQFDVSVGAVLGLSAIVSASALSDGVPFAIAVLVALGVCAVVGLVNGVLIAYIGVNSFIVTLAAGTLIGGLVSLYTGNATIVEGIPAALTDFGSAERLGLPLVVWAVALVAVLLGVVLGRTAYGRRLTAVGVSQDAARLVGINVRAVITMSFVSSSMLAGAAGIVLLARTGTGNPQVGDGYTLAALSAAFLGATTIRPGQFNVAGTLAGVLFVAVSVNGLVLAGAKDWVDPVFNGAALMLALTFSTLLGRARAIDRGNSKRRAEGQAAHAPRPQEAGPHEAVSVTTGER